MKVLVTRPRGQAEATARRLAALGHEALRAPVLDVVPTEEPVPAGPFDALLVTSSNAVPALAAERERLSRITAFAVGRRTADQLRVAGFASVEEAAGDSLDLVWLVRASVPSGARLLYAAGRDRKVEPARSLVDAGYDLQVWDCYEAVAARSLPQEAREALRSGQAEVILHYSRRSAALVASLIREAGLGEAVAGTVHLCLSADVAQGLRSLVGIRILIAQRPDEESLLALLARAGRPPGSQPPQSGC